MCQSLPALCMQSQLLNFACKVITSFSFVQILYTKPQKYSIGSNFSTEWLEVANANRVVSEGVAYQ